LIEANYNATNLLRIYIRQSLASKRLIFEEKFTTQSLNWLVGEIKSRFESALVHPGEMVGSIAAHSLGEPAT
jgi:DNA-directed RNA polymerase II subunit RPB1